MVRFFDQIITNFESAMRGLSYINGKQVKAFPHVAGSVFISKVVSLLRTVVNDKNIYSNLDSGNTKDRIYRNGKALVTMMVTDETVETENMLLIFESFQNVSIDTYIGMKSDGKFGKLQKELKDFETHEEEENDEVRDV